MAEAPKVLDTAEIDLGIKAVKTGTKDAISLLKAGKLEEALDQVKQMKKLQKKINKLEEEHNTQVAKYNQWDGMSPEDLKARLRADAQKAGQLKKDGDIEGAVALANDIKVLRQKIIDLEQNAEQPILVEKFNLHEDTSWRKDDATIENETTEMLEAGPGRSDLTHGDKAVGNEPHWVVMQSKAFTAWVTFVLAERGVFLDRDLGVVFDDGLKLIPFVEVLTEDKCMKHQKHVKFRVHQVENVNLAMKLLHEHGFDSDTSVEEIVDGNKKMILGFIYQLFVRFCGGEKEKDPKHDSLLDWVKEQVNGKYEGVPDVTGWCDDWQSGLLVPALLNSLGPHLMDYEKLDKRPKSALSNHIKGFHAAQTKLSVPPLLDPQDMVKDKPDKKCVRMYVQLIKNAWEKKAAEIAAKAAAEKAQRDATPRDDIWQMVDDYRDMLNGGLCRVCGACLSAVDERGRAAAAGECACPTCGRDCDCKKK